MSRKLLIATMVLGSSFAPFVCNALDSSNKTEISKEQWLNEIAPRLPELICEGFLQDADLKKRFDEIKMTSAQCVAAIPESTAKCKTELYDQMPATINRESASKWGRSLGECIGKDFAEKYLVPKS